MNLASILEESRTARPVVQAKHRWTDCYEVYQNLRGNRFSCQGAVEWMAKKGLIPKGEEARALKAFHVRTSRRNKKAAQ